MPFSTSSPHPPCLLFYFACFTFPPNFLFLTPFFFFCLLFRTCAPLSPAFRAHIRSQLPPYHPPPSSFTRYANASGLTSSGFPTRLLQLSIFFSMEASLFRRLLSRGVKPFPPLFHLGPFLGPLLHCIDWHCSIPPRFHPPLGSRPGGFLGFDSCRVVSPPSPSMPNPAH